MPILSSLSPSDAARDELRALLARDPQLGGGEPDRLASLMKKVRLLDVGLLPGALITWAVAQVA